MQQQSISSKAHTRQLVMALGECNQDFEFYPTTVNMLDTIKADIVSRMEYESERADRLSVLDCGAGDGRALKHLTSGKRYAIEKARPLLDSLDKSIFVVGTDFAQNTLLDKKVDIIFSNPPYKEFAQWAVKIIKEANAPYVYLVIPSRWRNNSDIRAALELREADAEIIATESFLEADRAARATADIIRVKLGSFERYRSGHYMETNPFTIWFDEHFQLDAPRTSHSKRTKTRMNSEDLKKELNGELVKDEGLVKVLERFYVRDLDNLMTTYLKLNELDSDLLSELDINVASVREALQLKVSSLKDTYWRQLFDNLGVITDKLTASSRESLLQKLFESTHVDFTAENAHAIVIWVIKQANQYFDDQLVEVVEGMVTKDNIENYVSNQRTFGSEEWYYNRRPNDLEKYKLELRIICSNKGGLAGKEWLYQQTASGLSKRASTFINDLRTLASNLGFDTSNEKAADDFQWESNKKVQLMYYNHTKDKQEVLFEAKAFWNGNIHIKFNRAFICKMNVEFGRLKGWLKTKQQAAEELNESVKDISNAFNSNLQLTAQSLPALLTLH